MNQAKRLEATVHGRVQGVGFRWFVRREAARLNLRGWVANQSDGSVRVVVEGDAQAVDQVMTLLHQGPPGAMVDGVDADYPAATGQFSGFDIRPGAHPGD